MKNGWIASWRKTAAAATNEPDSGYSKSTSHVRETVLVKMR